MFSLCSSSTSTRMWGLLSRRIAHTDRLHTDKDVIATLQEELERPGVRHWVGATCEVHCEKLAAVRNWKENWRSFGIGLEGGLLADKSANHVFILMQRKGWIVGVT